MKLMGLQIPSVHGLTRKLCEQVSGLKKYHKLENGKAQVEINDTITTKDLINNAVKSTINEIRGTGKNSTWMKRSIVNLQAQYQRTQAESHRMIC